MTEDATEILLVSNLLNPTPKCPRASPWIQKLYRSRYGPRLERRCQRASKLLLLYYLCWRSHRVELKVRRFGNSLGVVLPKEVINRLQTKDGEALFLMEGPDGSYRLSPYDPTFEKKMEKAEDLISRYRNTLHVLSK
jgi:putative addiction module antidote